MKNDDLGLEIVYYQVLNHLGIYVAKYILLFGVVV